MRDLPPTPPERHGVFTSVEAARAGLTYDALRNAVHTDRIVRLDRGIYGPVVAGDDMDARRERFAAASVCAVLACRPAIASHRSAASLAGHPVWTLPERACVTVPPRYTGDARTGHLHRATLSPAEVLTGVVDRTRAARTVVDVAREARIEEAVVVGDSALRLGSTDLDRIARTVLACAGWPGIGRARHLVDLLDGRSESPLESVSRLRMLHVGLPAPEPQVEIFDRAGHFLGRLDFYWDDYGVAGEVDGKIKFRERPEEAAWRQVRRQELMSDTGLVFLRWGRADLQDMTRLAARLNAAFARGRRVPASDRGWIALPTGSRDGSAPRISAS